MCVCVSVVCVFVFTYVQVPVHVYVYGNQVSFSMPLHFLGQGTGSLSEPGVH